MLLGQKQVPGTHTKNRDIYPATVFVSKVNQSVVRPKTSTRITHKGS